MKASAMSKVVRFALLIVIAHTIVVALHSAAHQILSVQASPAQLVFIVAVIIIAPPLAGVLIWKGAKEAGTILLACSMAGSLVFGVYNHFVTLSPDHVSEISSMQPATWAVIFQATAAILAIVEALGVYCGIVMLKGKRAG